MNSVKQCRFECFDGLLMDVFDGDDDGENYSIGID